MPNLNQGFLTSFVVFVFWSLDGALGVQCSPGYYGTTACTKCPAYQTVAANSAANTTAITGCYISKSATMSDASGEYSFFSSDCYYKQDSSGPGTDNRSIRNRLIGILENKYGQKVDSDSITNEQTLMEAIYIPYGMDSLDVVEVWVEIEEEFGIRIAEEEAQKVQTVGELIDLIQRELG